MNVLRIAVTLIGAVGIWLGNGFLATVLFGDGYSMPGHVFRAISTAILVAALLALVLRLWPIDIGLRPNPRRLRLAGIGAIAYAVPFAIGAAIILTLSLATLSIEAAALWRMLVVLALVLLFEAIPEELIFRGVIYASLRKRLAPWATILIQAALFTAFGLAIGAATDPLRVVLFFTMSVALGIIRAATGSVYATIGFHAAFQLISQTINSPQWDVAVLADPELWFRDIAFYLAPLVVAPLAVAVGTFLWTRNRVRVGA